MFFHSLKFLKFRHLLLLSATSYSINRSKGCWKRPLYKLSHNQICLIRSSVTKLGIFFTFGNFSKPVGTIILPKLPTFLGYFCKRVQKLSFLMKYFWGTFIDIIVWLEAVLLEKVIKNNPIFGRQKHNWNDALQHHFWDVTLVSVSIIFTT